MMVVMVCIVSVHAMSENFRFRSFEGYYNACMETTMMGFGSNIRKAF